MADVLEIHEDVEGGDEFAVDEEGDRKWLIILCTYIL